MPKTSSPNTPSPQSPASSAPYGAPNLHHPSHDRLAWYTCPKDPGWWFVPKGFTRAKVQACCCYHNNTYNDNYGFRNLANGDIVVFRRHRITRFAHFLDVDRVAGWRTCTKVGHWFPHKHQSYSTQCTYMARAAGLDWVFRYRNTGDVRLIYRAA